MDTSIQSKGGCPIESSNGLSWKGPLKVIRSQPPCNERGHTITESLWLGNTSQITKPNASPPPPCPLTTSLSVTSLQLLNPPRDNDSPTARASYANASPPEGIFPNIQPNILISGLSNIYSSIRCSEPHPSLTFSISRNGMFTTSLGQ